MLLHDRYSWLLYSGIGLTAKSAEAGGISLIIIYNRYLTMSHQVLGFLYTDRSITVAASAWPDEDLSPV
jgi:hypothetical protein